MNLGKQVIYQAYPRSFKDTSGNGIGDLKGIKEKIPYLKGLGIDMVWLNPFFISPQNDNGYDIADYYHVDPAFGTDEDLDDLISEMDKAGIKLMFDMVLNHTSTEHEWFKKALDGDEKYQNYYYIREGKDGGYPTNWQSKFGGPAWNEFGDTGKYYLCLFDKTQADLNWHNPDLRDELYKIVNYWIDKGIDGFRFDVLNVIGKDQILEDSSGIESEEKKLYTDTPIVHKWIRELNNHTFGKNPEIITVGEMSSTNIENSIMYSSAEGNELSMVFNFHHLKVDYENGDKWTDARFDFSKLKDTLNKWQVEMQEGGGWNALFWNNHDQPRANNRFGDVENFPYETATMLAQTIHMMRGTPYIYQGEEIGMTDPDFKAIDDYKDIESHNAYKKLLESGKSEAEALNIIKKKSRDNSRTPMQWDDTENAGFTSSEPWIAVNDNYKTINTKKAMADRSSVYFYYRKLIELRKDENIISDGLYFPILEDDDKIFAYIREYEGEVLINMNNFSSDYVEVNLENILEDYDKFTYLLGNLGERKIEKIIKLAPYESLAFIKRV
ncbi:alpha,alpha-phosphotrehalase [Anaerococcus prevotii]|uniref:Alpha,alpha-phosphotrehalase n=1 Tax=Anaerococcus prevotii ACS-065-V-Col13 TaxID=879305 RepID=F0GTD7_9FIRM|nr:alpha,alpha-phosphotrehalase [Anaerococcus prevotii]EGC82927.1 putative alpha,alpha-phosphotrehalase [Anaerococcus prevotii ACS-065-V-Col13]